MTGYDQGMPWSERVVMDPVAEPVVGAGSVRKHTMQAAPLFFMLSGSL